MQDSIVFIYFEPLTQAYEDLTPVVFLEIISNVLLFVCLMLLKN